LTVASADPQGRLSEALVDEEVRVSRQTRRASKQLICGRTGRVLCWAFAGKVWYLDHGATNPVVQKGWVRG